MSRPTPSDLPALRAFLQAHAALIAEANRQKALESDVDMLLAYCSVIDQLQEAFDRLTRQISRLERAAVAA